MPESDSITLWLQKLKTGNSDEALSRLWAVYFEKLVRQAQRWAQTQRAIADGEDAALDAFDSFVRAVEHQRFPRLDDRHDLWRILLSLTRRKVIDQIERELTEKRGGGTIIQVSALAGSEQEPTPEALSREPNPREAALLAEQMAVFLKKLGSPEFRQIATWRLEGYSNAEIATKIGRVESTVERKLKTIREICRDAGWVAD